MLLVLGNLQALSAFAAEDIAISLSVEKHTQKVEDLFKLNKTA